LKKNRSPLVLILVALSLSVQLSGLLNAAKPSSSDIAPAAQASFGDASDVDTDQKHTGADLASAVTGWHSLAPLEHWAIVVPTLGSLVHTSVVSCASQRGPPLSFS